MHFEAACRTLDVARRIHVTGAEDSAAQRRFKDDFAFGLALLVSNQGRRPNGRRRMRPFEYARYQTPYQQALRLRLFGDL